MVQRQLTFEGHEIDRVFEFLHLIERSPDAKIDDDTVLVNIETVRCEARATLLTVEDNKVKVTTHVFSEKPEPIPEGYRRTLRFRQGGRHVDFGGANAIREEWRLKSITFSYGGQLPHVSFADAMRWIDIVLPLRGVAHVDRKEPEQLLARLRLLIMEVTPCAQRAEVIDGLKSRILEVLDNHHRILNPLEAAFVGTLLGDLRDRDFFVANVEILQTSQYLRSQHSFGVMRQLFLDESLRDDGTLSYAAQAILGQAVQQLDEMAWSGPEMVHKRKRDEVRQSLTFCWQVLEAISFAKAVNDPIHNDIVRAINALVRLEQSAPADFHEDVASALAGAMLCYAGLFKPSAANSSTAFHHSTIAVRTLLDRLLQRDGNTGPDVTQRIAAMAALALLTEEGPENVQAAFSALERSMLAINARSAQDQVEKDDEIAAGADACGLLFKKLTERRGAGVRKRKLPGEKALKIIADHWDKTISVAVRRACARNMLEGLWNGMPSAPIFRGLRAFYGSPAGSLRALRRNLSTPVPIDLPSQALLLALDDWALLPRLVLSDEYERHPNCKALAAALQNFVLAEQAYSEKRFIEALTLFSEASRAVRHIDATFLPEPFMERLAEGIDARAACCRIGGGEGDMAAAVENARNSYNGLLSRMISDEHHEFDPDFWMTRAFDSLLSAVHESRCWHSFKWSEEIGDQFKSAIEFVPPAESAQLAKFCRALLNGLVPNRVISAILGGSEQTFGYLPAPDALGSGAEWAISGLKGLLSYAVRAYDVMDDQSRERRVREAVDGLHAYKLRPVGIVGVGQALQW